MLGLRKQATPGGPGCSIWETGSKRELRTFLEGSLPLPHPGIAQKLSWPIRGHQKYSTSQSTVLWKPHPLSFILNYIVWMHPEIIPFMRTTRDKQVKRIKPRLVLSPPASQLCGVHCCLSMDQVTPELSRVTSATFWWRALLFYIIKNLELWSFYKWH